MSKIGRKPIDIKGVQVEVKGQEVHFKGQKSSGVHVLPDVLAASTGDTQGTSLWAMLRQQVTAKQVSSDNLLMTRLQLFLSQSHPSDDVDEAFGITEREYMRGSFALSRFMVWAIPILGFIGTVWGISNGIAHFSDAMTSTSSVTDVSSMLKDNLPLVTNS